MRVDRRALGEEHPALEDDRLVLGAADALDHRVVAAALEDLLHVQLDLEAAALLEGAVAEQVAGGAPTDSPAPAPAATEALKLALAVAPSPPTPTLALAEALAEALAPGRPRWSGRRWPRPTRRRTAPAPASPPRPRRRPGSCAG